ncbi:hypothetical protein [aff. Roholtiella sp. LEGE 12411]|uniref:hypothetical protein n=1 Tax=aff. Roholtiella sp. LEGE 12411 TaxID=1828822 RepID=UPI00187F7216|nr:hypothetical protein [aff. Roholtiella sp. LEGE 12411]MBE9035826.1 hypothetical protein [aff. Roholtiella sp. LEGE 12411]
MSTTGYSASHSPISHKKSDVCGGLFGVALLPTQKRCLRRAKPTHSPHPLQDRSPYILKAIV